MLDLADLIARVEGATEGSRELAADICEALGFKVHRHSTTKFGRRRAAWAYLAPDKRWHAVGPILFSIDAALALVERKLPGAFWHVAKGRMTAAEPLFGAALFFDADEELGHGESFNAATSLVLALLRSLQAGAQN